MEVIEDQLAEEFQPAEKPGDLAWALREPLAEAARPFEVDYQFGRSTGRG